MKFPPLKQPVYVAIVIGVVVTVLLMLYVYVEKSAPEPLAAPNNVGQQSNTPESSAKADESAAALAPGSQKDVNDQTGRVVKTVRSRLKSGSPRDLDYAMLYAWINCSAMSPDWDAATAVRNTLSYPGRAVTDEGLIIGGASELKRMESFSRAKATCLKMFEGKSLSDTERKEVLLTPAYKDYTSLKKVFNEMKRTDTPEVKSALSAMVRERTLGLLSSVLYEHLDTQPLEKSYGEGRGAALSTAAIYIIQCRLGGDCGPGQLQTENLCWQHAICGNNLEDALMANLNERGVDTAAFIRYVDRVTDALQKNDTSVLRSAPSTDTR